MVQTYVLLNIFVYRLRDENKVFWRVPGVIGAQLNLLFYNFFPGLTNGIIQNVFVIPITHL